MSKRNRKDWAWAIGWTLWILAIIGTLGSWNWLGVIVGGALLIGSGWFDLYADSDESKRDNDEY